MTPPSRLGGGAAAVVRLHRLGRGAGWLHRLRRGAVGLHRLRRGAVRLHQLKRGCQAAPAEERGCRAAPAGARGCRAAPAGERGCCCCRAGLQLLPCAAPPPSLSNPGLAPAAAPAPQQQSLERPPPACSWPCGASSAAWRRQGRSTCRRRGGHNFGGSFHPGAVVLAACSQACSPDGPPSPHLATLQPAQVLSTMAASLAPAREVQAGLWQPGRRRASGSSC